MFKLNYSRETISNYSKFLWKIPQREIDQPNIINNKIQVELFEKMNLKFHSENLTSLIFVNNKIQVELFERIDFKLFEIFTKNSTARSWPAQYSLITKFKLNYSRETISNYSKFFEKFHSEKLTSLIFVKNKVQEQSWIIPGNRS